MGSHVVLITSDRIGEGPDELGRILMTSFLKSLAATSENPSAVVFLNSGVKLTTSGSEYIEVLTEIESQGAVLLSCGTCLDFFRLKDELKVGEIGNMADAVDRLQLASSVLRI